ncbi:unnamed protein product [Owenia fusiformis]|uniref:Uncharacterized protein n=1 Tax=Owenia fusiformis TaxID=6347 RepID=A0A8J1TTB2_OWEFU|nr:unnamed protein product [Owenia fusiformis]
MDTNVDSAVPAVADLGSKPHETSNTPALSNTQHSTEKVVTNKMHCSIVKSVDDIVYDKCKKSGCLASKESHIHCPLCPAKEDTYHTDIDSVKQHVLDVHWPQVIEYEGLCYMLCMKYCYSKKRSELGLGHYHCPHCNKMFIKGLEVKHLDEHKLEALAQGRPEKIFQTVTTVLSPELLSYIPQDNHIICDILQRKFKVTCSLAKDQWCVVKASWEDMTALNRYLLPLTQSTRDIKKVERIIHELSGKDVPSDYPANRPSIIYPASANKEVAPSPNQVTAPANSNNLLDNVKDTHDNVSDSHDDLNPDENSEHYIKTMVPCVKFEEDGTNSTTKSSDVSDSRYSFRRKPKVVWTMQEEKKINDPGYAKSKKDDDYVYSFDTLNAAEEDEEVMDADAQVESVCHIENENRTTVENNEENNGVEIISSEAKDGQLRFIVRVEPPEKPNKVSNTTKVKTKTRTKVKPGKTKTTRFQCEHCGRNFCNNFKKNVHLKNEVCTRKFGNKDRMCPLCKKVFDRPCRMKAHFEAKACEKKTELSLFSCSACPFISQKKFAMDNHMESIHNIITREKEHEFSCKICDKRFATLYNLARHEREIHGTKPPTQKMVECQECGKCMYKKNMKEHMRTKHNLDAETVAPFECSQCGKCFTRKSSLTTHALMHIPNYKATRRYQCKDCGKSFQKYTVLMEHMNKHIDVRPFKCELCDKCFYSRGALKVHTLIHSGLDYNCNICEKKFKVKRYLERHLEYHHQMNPPEVPLFQCNNCGELFYNRELLSKHQSLGCGNTDIDAVACETETLLALAQMSSSSVVVASGDENQNSYPNVTNSVGETVAENVVVTITDGDIITAEVGDKRRDALDQEEVILNNQIEDNNGDTVTEQFMCGVCSVVFETIEEANVHMETHTNDTSNEENTDQNELAIESSENNIENTNVSSHYLTNHHLGANGTMHIEIKDGNVTTNYNVLDLESST